MPKAYWIVNADVHDSERYGRYVAEDTAIIESFGGRFLVRGGQADIKEGQSLPRHVVVEFDSLQQAEDCYHSKAYQQAKSWRDGAATFHLIIVEGVAG
jgi:uncharacterized protein (DUF1330 family)